MQALILAAGFGTRLYPLTYNLPKALIKINNKPLINYILEKINKIPEIETIYILSNNKFYIDFLEWKKDFKHLTNKKIRVINDGISKATDLKGILNDFKFILEIIDEKDLLVLASDNLFEFDLKKLINLGDEKNSSVSALKIINDNELIKKYSCVLLDKDKKIIDFTEKPKKPNTNLASVFTYYIKKNDLIYIKDSEANETKNIIEFLFKKTTILGHVFDEFWCDIGSPEELKNAEKHFSKQI